MSTNPPIRTLLVGVGARGKTWARLLAEEATTDTVGYVDLRPENLAWVREQYMAGAEACFNDLRTALAATAPELVVLATPPMDRYGEVVAVFAAGAHLLSEKPLTLDFDEGIRIVNAAEAAGCSFAVGLNFRYQHCVQAARAIFASGEIGQPSFARYVYWRNRDGYRPGLNRFPLTMRQPMLYEQTIHHVDAMRFTYGRDITRVWCRSHNPPCSMYRDDATVTALLEFDGDLLVDYFGTWSAQAKVDEFRWRTDCTDGALFQYAMFADLRIARGRDATTVEPIALPAQEQLVDDARLMLTDVVAQMRRGERRPHPSGVDHLKTFGVIAAMEESARTGQSVEMGAFFARHAVPPEWL